MFFSKNFLPKNIENAHAVDCFATRNIDYPCGGIWINFDVALFFRLYRIIGVVYWPDILLGHYDIGKFNVTRRPGIVVKLNPDPVDIQVFWGYALFPDRIGNFVAKSMADCNGAEILQELCGHLRFDLETVEKANCIPCRMPSITSQFMPRLPGDRPLPVPPNSKNLAFISQFVEIPDDVVFTVEYSVRAAQMAVYELLAINWTVPASRFPRTHCRRSRRRSREVC